MPLRCGVSRDRRYATRLDSELRLRVLGSLKIYINMKLLVLKILDHLSLVASCIVVRLGGRP